MVADPQELPLIADGDANDGNAKWYSYFERQFVYFCPGWYVSVD